MKADSTVCTFRRNPNFTHALQNTRVCVYYKNLGYLESSGGISKLRDTSGYHDNSLLLEQLGL